MISELNQTTMSCDGTPNAQLRTAVFESLGLAGHRGLRGVQVDVEDDRVVLSGTVSSYYLKQMAQETARQVCPGRKVYNGLDVIKAT